MWLIGMMGSGKTSAGRLVAQNANVPFYDTDYLVEERAGIDIAKLWSERGEQAFRRIETEVVLSLPSDGVIAGGGGVVVAAENRTRIAAEGPVIWLRASPEALITRTGGDTTRPLLAGSDPLGMVRALSEQREPLYASIADHTIDTDGMTVSEVAEEVTALWRS